ncbi:PREDICTED: torsin-1A-like [Branchiostoma belcheri]|uniref:Torsin-1A-like n=1 Tax=Branchiostoma belcheri TaxID=7741 RepID=A0A6P4ZJZ6_BRABE|nr:PREDICTED: torsin-1A-like [Branchiostoma belcheri]
MYSSTPQVEPVTKICEGEFNPNITYLRMLLTKRLYGQPLVRDVVVKAIQGHLTTPKTSKALVLSFHGPSGVGKTYVTNMIAKAIFTNGTRSPYVIYYSAEIDFKHADELHTREYKKQLRRAISERVSQCQHSIFIFDHVDRMPRDLIDTIKPFVEEYARVDGINFRKAVFILISYSASDAIIKMTMKLRSEEIEREEFSLEGFEEAITKSALGREGHLPWQEELLTQGLIDHVVPFLPLAVEHVEMCIRDVLRELNKETNMTMVRATRLRRLADEMPYLPKHALVQYSQNGCFRVRNLVITSMADMD